MSSDMITRKVIAAVIRRAKTPVCVRVDGQMERGHLARLAKLSVGFLINWREVASAFFNDLHHNRSDLLVLLGGPVTQDDYPTFLKALECVGVHGCILDDAPIDFLRQCRDTDRFIWLKFPRILSAGKLPENVSAVWGRQWRRKKKNVGGAVNVGQVPTLGKYASELPLLLFCDGNNWCDYPSAMQAAADAPGMRLVMLGRE